MTTICSNCGHDITENEVNNDNFVLCPFCNRFIPKGAHSFVGRVIGGKKRVKTHSSQDERRSERNMAKQKAKTQKVVAYTEKQIQAILNKEQPDKDLAVKFGKTLFSIRACRYRHSKDKQ